MELFLDEQAQDGMVKYHAVLQAVKKTLVGASIARPCPFVCETTSPGKALLPLHPTSPLCTNWADAGGTRHRDFSAPCVHWDCKPNKPCWLPPTA